MLFYLYLLILEIFFFPSRFESKRLPGKPLINILGKPMIQRVYERCLKAVDNELIYIATDDNRIKLVAENFGANVIMTSWTNAKIAPRANLNSNLTDI